MPHRRCFTGSWMYQRSEYASDCDYVYGSEYARVLNMPCSEYASGSEYTRVLNMLGLCRVEYV